MQPEIEAFVDAATGSVAYLVVDPATGLCALVDPVLGYDHDTGEVCEGQMQALLTRIRAQDHGPTWILITAVDADHLSAAGRLKYETGASTCIGGGVVQTIATLGPQAGAADLDPYGYDFDKHAQPDDPFPLGALQIEALPLPGGPEATAYRIGDHLFPGAAAVAAFDHLPDDMVVHCGRADPDGRHDWSLAQWRARAAAPDAGRGALSARQAAILRVNLKAGRHLD